MTKADVQHAIDFVRQAREILLKETAFDYEVRQAKKLLLEVLTLLNKYGEGQ